MQHNSNGSSDLNRSVRLSAPAINNQSTGATLTMSSDQLLSQRGTVNSGMQLMIWPWKTLEDTLVKGLCGTSVERINHLLA